MNISSTNEAISICTICGYQGEINEAEKVKVKVCLNCYLRFYGEYKQENKEEDNMAWNDINEKSSRDPDVVNIAPNTTKLIHILLRENEEPVSFWTHYIPNSTGKSGPKGALVICPGKDICPACANGTYRTSRKHAINVWDYDTKSVKILESGNTIFNALKQIKEHMGTFDNVDISIKRSGDGKDTTYTVIPIPIMSPFDNSKIRGLFPIAQMRMPHSVEAITAYIEGMGGRVVKADSADVNIPPGGDMTQPPQQEVDNPNIDNTKSTDMASATSLPPMLQFGKYKGKTIEEVYKEDPNYIRWCAENISDPTIKAEASKLITNRETTHQKTVLSLDTEKAVLINTINEIFNEDPRYKGNFNLILEKMKAASVSTLHPNGKTILKEYELQELQRLEEIIK